MRKTFFFLSVTAILLAPAASHAQSWATLANPHWNITLTDAGYSDFLLDNTPGFEGREYLSGEWGAAVGYQVTGGTNVTAQWLEPHFIFPDWNTDSHFTVVTPISQTGLNADNLPIAESVIANEHLRITQRFEMLDTVMGTPMGTTRASAGGTGTFLHSNRYVMKQTYTIKNITGTSLTNVRLFQFLHGLNSQRGVFDNRIYTGQLSAFRYDTTMAGVDPWASTGGNSSGLEDFIGFTSTNAPDAHEIGYYGIEGNGVDAHGIGKPSDGVHLSIENNWQTAPYSTRQGTDSFAPAQRWIGGAQRWTLGSLAANQSVSIDVLLTILTGTKVTTGTGSGGGCGGGSSVPGGLDYFFDDVTESGSCFAEFSRADDDEIAVRIAAGEFDDFSILTPGKPAQIWRVEFSGNYAGNVTLTLAYDHTLLPVDFDESTLAIYQYTGGNWQMLLSTVDTFAHTVTITTDTLSAFALGVEGGSAFNINGSVAPANSGTITGAGAYANGSSVTLAAATATGYVFANWTDGATVVSTSPNFNFTVAGDRSLVANFNIVGTGKAITTSSSPVNGGATGGGGEYALGSSATVTATPAPGYKFSKWLVNGVSVSTTNHYTFTVSGDRSLVAKFKPIYVIAVTADPPEGGEYEVDAVYEMGELAKLKAIPLSGYCFVNWTQNGVEVSTATDFSFTVTGNRELMANFALGHRIDTFAEPLNAGDATGGGVYGDGDLVTVEAVPKTGYVFLNWTDAGAVVSSSPSYTFTADANHTLVANFTALPSITPVVSTPGTLTITWPAGANSWVLQESPDLSPDSWVDSPRTVTIAGGQNQVAVLMTEPRRFFRLRYP